MVHLQALDKDTNWYKMAKKTSKNKTTTRKSASAFSASPKAVSSKRDLKATTRQQAGSFANQRYTLLFLGLALFIGYFSPWADLKLATFSGFKIASSFSTIDANLQRAFVGPVAMIFPAILAFILSTVGLVLFVKPDIFERAVAQRIVLWVVGLSSAVAATTIILNSQSDKVELVRFAVGYFITCSAMIGTVLYALFALSRVDKENNNPTSIKELVFPLLFLAVFIIATLINYKYVNYSLIPPAPKVLKR